MIIFSSLNSQFLTFDGLTINFDAKNEEEWPDDTKIWLLQNDIKTYNEDLKNIKDDLESI